MRSAVFRGVITVLTIAQAVVGAEPGQVARKQSTPVDRASGSSRAAATKPTCALIGLDSSSLAALVEAKLLKNERAVWLERNQVQVILAEQELQALLAANAGAQRIALGKTLKAQILVVLRRGQDKDRPCADLVVCETERGVRLLARNVPLCGKAEDDAAAIAACVDEALRRFSGAVQEIYAVPPLLSKNLAYDRDYLRIAYARVIEQTLFEQRGTVVVEIAEAESIAREIALSGEMPSRRLPLFVLGEYQNEGQGADARVRIALILRRGERQLAQAKETMPDAAAADFFRKTLASFARAAGRETFQASAHDREEEIRQLVRLAEDHRRLGDWSESLALAEAALALNPNQPEMHRLALVAVTGELKSGHDGKIASLQARRQHYRRGLQHMEALIRSGGKSEDYQQPGGRAVVGDFLRCRTTFIDAAVPKDLKDLEETAQQEHRETMSRVARYFAERGQMEAALHYCRISAETLGPRRQYAELLKMILEFQDVPGQAVWVRHGTQGPFTLDVFDAAEGREFLADLINSPSAKPYTKQIARVLQETADRVVAQADKVAAAPPVALPPAELSRPGLTFRPIELRVMAPAGISYPVRRVRCVPLGEGTDLYWDAKSLFLMKTRGILTRIREDIRVGRVDLYPGSTYQDLQVVWDGRYAWVIAQPPPTPQVLVIDPASERIWELDRSDGLPLLSMDETPAKMSDYRVLAAPWGPGEVCMAGGFGRTWVAIVRFDPGGRSRVRLFHEARETQNADDREQWKKSTVAFCPSFMATLKGGRDHAGKPVRRVLIGRGDSQHTVNFDLSCHPLVVDPETPSVEVVRQQLETPHNYDLRDGAIYSIGVSADRPKELAVQRIGLPDLAPMPFVTAPKDGLVLFSGDRLNVVGKQWWTGSLSEKQLACLGDVPWYYLDRRAAPSDRNVVRPQEYQLDWIGRSNHYGLLARLYHSRNRSDSPDASVITQVLVGDTGSASGDHVTGPKPFLAEPETADALSTGRQSPALEQLAAGRPVNPQVPLMTGLFRPFAIHFTDRSQTSVAAMSLRGRYLAMGTANGVTLLWSLRNKAAVRILEGHERQIEMLGFSADEKRLVTYGMEGTAKVWDVESGAEILQISDKSLRKITRVIEPYGDTPVPLIRRLAWNALLLSPDGRMLVAKNPLITQFWNLETKELDYHTSLLAQVGGFLPDGTLLALANDGHRSLIAWDPKTRASRQLAKESWGDLLAISPDGNQIAMRERIRALEGRLVPSCRVAVWDPLKKAMICVFDGQPDQPTVAAFTADGKTLNVGLAGGTVRRWKIAELQDGVGNMRE